MQGLPPSLMQEKNDLEHCAILLLVAIITIEDDNEDMEDDDDMDMEDDIDDIIIHRLEHLSLYMM